MDNCNRCAAGVTAAPAYNQASSCNNPPTQLETVTIPVNQGSDGPNDPYAPKLGAWRNTIVVYQKTGSVYLYDVNGVYTNLTGTDYAAQIVEAMADIERLQTNIATLQAALDAETANRTASDNAIDTKLVALQTALANETTERINAISNLTSAVNQANALSQSTAAALSNETTAREAADSTLQAALETETAARESANTELAAKVENNTESLTNLQSEYDQIDLDKTVMFNLTAQNGTSTVTLVKTTGVLNQETTTETNIPLPVASAEQAGVMNINMYNDLVDMSARLQVLEGSVVEVQGLSATPTQEELTTAWKTASGQDELVNQAKIYDSDNSKIWTYYSNTAQWVDEPADGASVSVAQATNTSLGIVKGSTEAGQVAVESDGSLSLNGWDAVNASVATNTTNIAVLQSTIGTIQNTLARLDSGAGVN